MTDEPSSDADASPDDVALADLTGRVNAFPPVRFWRGFSATGPSVLAAAVAYNIFFALVPALAAMVAGASFFGRDTEAIRQTREVLEVIAPGEVARFVSVDLLPDVADSIQNKQGLFVAVTGLVSLWLASRGVITMMRVLARIEHMDDTRSWWRVRVVGIVLTVGAVVALLSSALLLVAASTVGDWIADLGGQDWLVNSWDALAVPLGSLALLIFLVALYRFGPPAPLPGRWLAALLASVGIVGASLGFRLYLERVGAAGGTLAVFGAIAVLLLWLHVIAYVIIVAAAFSAATFRKWGRA